MYNLIHRNNNPNSCTSLIKKCEYPYVPPYIPQVHIYKYHQMNPLFHLEFGPLEEQSEQGFPLQSPPQCDTLPYLKFQIKQNPSSEDQISHNLRQCLRFVSRQLQRLNDFGEKIVFQVVALEAIGQNKQQSFRKKYRLIYKCQCGAKWYEDHQNVTVSYQIKSISEKSSQHDSEVESQSEDIIQSVVRFNLKMSEVACKECSKNAEAEMLEKDITLFAKRFGRHLMKALSGKNQRRYEKDMLLLMKRFGGKRLRQL